MLLDAIRDRVDSHSRSGRKFSFGLTHLQIELYHDVTHIAKVIFPELFFKKTFINHLIPRNGEASKRNERADAHLKIYDNYRVNGAGHRCDVKRYEYRALSSLTSGRNQKILSVVFFMIGAHFVLYASLSAKGCGQSSIFSRTLASMNRRSHSSTRAHHAGRRILLLLSAPLV
jgi:hypothetical protein